MNNKRIEWDYAWVEDNFDKCDSLQTLNTFYNEAHGTDICYRTFKGFCQRQGYKKCNLTLEQDRFIIENYPRYGAVRTAEMYNATFGKNKTAKQIRSLAHNRHLKIADADMYAKVRSEARWRSGSAYQVGESSKGWKEPYVKVGDNKWIAEGLYNYTQAYGEVPKDHVVLHLDNDKHNNNLENLVAIPKRYMGKLTRNRLYSHNAMVTRGAIMLMELEDKLNVFQNGTSLE